MWTLNDTDTDIHIGFKSYIMLEVICQDCTKILMIWRGKNLWKIASISGFFYHSVTYISKIISRKHLLRQNNHHEYHSRIIKHFAIIDNVFRLVNTIITIKSQIPFISKFIIKTHKPTSYHKLHIHANIPIPHL